MDDPATIFRIQRYKPSKMSFGESHPGKFAMDDPYALQRFLDAQNNVYEQVCAELGSGRKTGHWMWFIFPQIRGLGASETARRFAISSLVEAEAYLQHPVLGPRLRECTGLVLQVEGKGIDRIFGDPDDLKFHSSMTLFAHAGAVDRIFLEALNRYFGGRFDRNTLDRI